MTKICQYRNCENEFDVKEVTPDNKLYCSRACKNKESIYKKRDLVPKRKRGRKFGENRCKSLGILNKEDMEKLALLRPYKN